MKRALAVVVPTLLGLTVESAQADTSVVIRHHARGASASWSFRDADFRRLGDVLTYYHEPLTLPPCLTGCCRDADIVEGLGKLHDSDEEYWTLLQGTGLRLVRIRVDPERLRDRAVRVGVAFGRFFPPDRAITGPWRQVVLRRGRWRTIWGPEAKRYHLRLEPTLPRSTPRAAHGP